MTSQHERIQRLTAETVEIARYNPEWPAQFEREKAHLLGCLPGELIVRIEHVGSTAVPGLDAKPIIDVLVEVTDLEAVEASVVPVLEAQGYEYLWRPSLDDGGEPFYAWFIRREPLTGVRTHHIHMVEGSFPQWEWLQFRDYLIGHPETAARYAALKRRLAEEFPNDRERYTHGKTEFIGGVMACARADAATDEPPDGLNEGRVRR